MKSTTQRLFDMIEEQGWKAEIVPIGHLVELKEAVCILHDRGLLSESFYANQLGFLSFEVPKELPEAQSILIVAVPTPPMRIFFQRNGSRVPVIIPPTYVSYTRRTEEAQTLLAKWLAEEGYQLAKPRLPLKTLAVRSGLAEYGRNNICYVSGMGSFLQLVGAFTDLPCPYDPWREPKALDLCDSCVACRRGCPTGAISGERFLLFVERCLTYHNEAETDFPDWIDPSWHHCLVGCLHCQTACPENKEVVNWYEDRVEFFEQETNLLIQRVPFDCLLAETTAKVGGLEINEAYPMLCRNLSMIIDR
jgi:epoxyqueuosine reductase